MTRDRITATPAVTTALGVSNMAETSLSAVDSHEVSWGKECVCVRVMECTRVQSCASVCVLTHLDGLELQVKPGCVGGGGPRSSGGCGTSRDQQGGEAARVGG